MPKQANLFPLLPRITPDLSPKTGWASLFKDPPIVLGLHMPYAQPDPELAKALA